MIFTLTGKDRRAATALFEKLFRLRCQVFRDERGWSIPTHNGLEFDQYDDLEAKYFFELDDNGSVRSHVRLNPTNQGSLLADYFPHLVDDKYEPRGPNIWEATRFLVLPQPRGREEKRRTEARLFSAMLEWAEVSGVGHIQAVLEKTLYPTFLQIAPQTFPMGLTQPYGGGQDVVGGGEVLAVRCPVNRLAIEEVRIYGGLEQPDCSECMNGCSSVAA